MYLLWGYLIGLGTVIFIGPVLFTLLKATWQRGHRAGIAVALGIIVSDIIVVGVCYAGSSAFSKEVDQYVPKFWIGMAGAALLLALGIKYILNPGSSLMASVTTKADHPLAFFTRGFLINTLNPSVFVVWVAIIETWSKQLGYGYSMVAFLFMALLGIFSMDMTKVFTANFIKPYMTPRILDYIYRGIGGLLLLFCALMVYKSWAFR